MSTHCSDSSRICLYTDIKTLHPFVYSANRNMQMKDKRAMEQESKIVFNFYSVITQATQTRRGMLTGWKYKQEVRWSCDFFENYSSNSTNVLDYLKNAIQEAIAISFMRKSKTQLGDCLLWKIVLAKLKPERYPGATRPTIYWRKKMNRELLWPKGCWEDSFLTNRRN